MTCGRLFEEIKSGAQPLRGLFHLAMVIDDAPLAALTPSAFEPSSDQRHTAHGSSTKQPRMKLDCFVMFSSVSSIFGNPAQGNYSAANAFLDSLAHHRQGARPSRA